jgi:exonuclease III
VGESLATRTSIQPRQNKDKIVTPEGRKLINFCTEMEFHLLNGSHVSDKNGNFTLLGSRRASVIDYILCSSNILPLITNFYVDARAESVHMPVVLELQIEKYTQRPLQ